MKIKLLFAWYDLWIGAFWDQAKRRLYILPIPCCGIIIEFPKRMSLSERAMCRMIELSSKIETSKQSREMSHYFSEHARVIDAMNDHAIIKPAVSPGAPEEGGGK